MKHSLGEFTAERIARHNESAYPALMTISLLLKVAAVIGGIIGVVVGFGMLTGKGMPDTQRLGILVIVASFFSALSTYGYAEILNTARDTALNTASSTEYLSAILTQLERDGNKGKSEVASDFSLGRVPTKKPAQQSRPTQPS